MTNRRWMNSIRDLTPLLLLTAGLTACGDDKPAGPRNPLPVLSRVAPDTVAAGSAALALSLTGDGFMDGSEVRWNGAPRPTDYLSRQRLQANIPAADLRDAGAAELLVFNPGPGGGVSAPQTIFLVVADRPAPVLTGLSPAAVTTGRAFTLEIRGTGFVAASVVNWAGQPRPTTFLSGTRLSIGVTAADVAQPGHYAVTVTTPPPGGGASAAFDLVVTPPAPSTLRLLFMGNSLTYVNLLPVMVDSLAAAAGIPIVSTMMASPSYALVDHYDILERRTQVQNGDFDVVIMQQGPSSLPESRVLLLDGVRLWNPLIRAGGARPALFAVWPEKARMNVFPDVSESYRLAAVEVDGLFFPVGDTWLETWARQPDAALYGPDDFHPSVAGTYAAAVVIVSILGNRDPESLPAHFNLNPAIGVEPDSALGATIRAAAKAVIGRL